MTKIGRLETANQKSTEKGFEVISSKYKYKGKILRACEFPSHTGNLAFGWNLQVYFYLCVIVLHSDYLPIPKI